MTKSAPGMTSSRSVEASTLKGAPSSSFAAATQPAIASRPSGSTSTSESVAPSSVSRSSNRPEIVGSPNSVLPAPTMTIFGPDTSGTLAHLEIGEMVGADRRPAEPDLRELTAHVDVLRRSPDRPHRLVRQRVPGRHEVALEREGGEPRGGLEVHGQEVASNDHLVVRDR